MANNITLLIDQDTIESRIKEIAAEVSNDFSGESILCVCVLKGAFIFMADLLKHISVPTGISYMAVSSYNDQTKSSGDIKLELDLATNVEGRNVLLIEDIVDSGQTIKKLCDLLQKRNPKIIKVCTMVDRPDRRMIPVQLDYIGFTIPDKFLVGYGLDYAGQYRNLPYIGALDIPD